MNWYGIWTLKQLGLAWDIKRVKLADLKKGWWLRRWEAGYRGAAGGGGGGGLVSAATELSVDTEPTLCSAGFLFRRKLELSAEWLGKGSGCFNRPDCDSYPCKPRSSVPDSAATGSNKSTLIFGAKHLQAGAVRCSPRFLRITLLPTLIQAEGVHVAVVPSRHKPHRSLLRSVTVPPVA